MAEAHWHEDDEFWISMASFMFDEERWQNTPEEVDNLLAMIDPEPGSRVLDCPCGPGRHTLELARRGFQVTGVDRTKTYLNSARRQAEAEGLSPEFVLDDMRHFRRIGAFDVVLSMFTSLGYFDEQAENRQVLENYYASLRDGGVLLLEMSGKEVLARIYRRRDWHQVDDAFLLEERDVVDEWRRMSSRWILLKDGLATEKRFSHWIYSASELAAMLSDSGFSQLAFYGDLAGAPYDQEARRLVAVAHK